ncbi:ATP-binding protein [Rhodospirillaceae bacterium SYSU D60014]|uniref:HAMP domain-containing sensor histidine kinase n=1 Tax=Virgifigura deserti TaxID=2268457 RepID=UPI000E673AA6
MLEAVGQQQAESQTPVRPADAARGWIRRPLTLGGRIFWSVMPIILVLWVLVGAWSLYDQRQLMTTEFLKRGQAMAGNLAYSSELGVFTEDQQLLEASLRGVLGDPDVAYVAIYGEDGRILTRGGEDDRQVEAVSEALAPGEQARLVQRRQAFSNRIAGPAGDFIEFLAPILSEQARTPDELLIGPLDEARGAVGGPDQRMIGAVRLGLSLEGLEAHVVRLLQLWGSITVVLLSLSLIAIYTLSHRITRPVMRLTHQAKQIAAGVLDQVTQVESRDEIGQLAASFNQMAIALQRNIDEKEQALHRLRELNRTLEDRIRQRTSELEEQSEALQRSLKEVRVMAEITHAVSASLDLQWVLHSIARHAVDLSGSDGCAIFEFDPARSRFDVVASHNLATPFLEAIASVPVDLSSAVIAEPFQISDVEKSESYRFRDVLLQEGYRAALIVPMGSENATRGAVIFRRKPGSFDPRVVDFVTTLANQSKVAIDNARLFREVQHREIELENASKHKSQFLANMSHELRTPLNAILGYTELILDDLYGEVPARMREVLGRVEHNGRHLLNLINDVLDLSKIEAGRLTLSLDEYSMQQVVQSVVLSVETLAAEKGLALNVEVPADLPVGYGDERRLTQVLLNLVGNAIKFTEAGEILVRAVVSDDAFIVSVSDTGPGISEADRCEIFKEFHQVDNSSTRPKGGTGLGLAIAKRIIEMHGGRLGVESTLGIGSTFSFKVPIRVERRGHEQSYSSDRGSGR